MNFEFEQALRLAVALGIGLLLGLERERRKSRSAEPQAAGVRTFALVTVLGSLAAMIPIGGLPLVVGGFVAGMAAVSYLRSSTSDPGITTEIALMTAYMLGLLTQFDLATAAGLGVVVTILLAAREALHEFVTDKLSEQEFQDGLLLAAAALVILPLVPDRGVGPFQAFNPFTAWRFVVIVMVASSAGYLAQRLFGAGFGLPVAGFFGGFVSSTATIAAMRSRASGAAAVQPAVAGAVLSNVATVLQLGVVVVSVSTETFVVLVPSLVLGAVTAIAYGAAITLLARGSLQAAALPLGRPFELKSALTLAALVSVVMVGSTVLLNLLGEAGAIVAAAAGGFADAHAQAISMATLVAAGRLSPVAAVVPILAGMTANSLTKIVVAVDRCTPAFTIQVAAGVVLVAAAMWVALPISATLAGHR